MLKYCYIKTDNSEVKNMIRTVDNVEKLPKTIEMISKNEALEMLKSSGITKSSGQMLNVWVQNGELDGYKVKGGRVEDRGLYFRKEDILIFIEFKTLTFSQFKKLKKNQKHQEKDDENIVIEGQTSLYDIFENDDDYIQGILIKRPDKRYEIENTEIYFTSGERIEYWDENRGWIKSRVEHTNDDYYIVDFGKDKKIAGLKVRTK